MKKLSFNLLFVLAVFFFLTSCKKDIDTKVVSTPNNSPNMELAKNGDPSISFNNLNAKVKIENGTLIFNTSDDFTNTIDFLSNATEAEIAKWENSLIGFTSVTKNYDTARKALNDTGNIDSLQKVYNGKVIIKSDGTIEPILKNGVTFGRIVNEKGLYRIGEAIVKYSNDMVISIPDGDEKKLLKAINTIKHDIPNGIYIHPLKLGEITPNLDNNILQTRSFCSNGCPTSESGGGNRTFGSNGSQYRISGNFSILDNTSIVSAGICSGNAILVNIHANTNVVLDKWVKPFLQSWQWRETSSDGGFNWGFGWGIDITINGYTGFYFPLQAHLSRTTVDRQQAGGYSWNVTNSGRLNADIPLWSGNLPGCTNVYNTMISNWVNNGITICANRTGLRANALNPSLNNVWFETFCQK